MKTNLKPEIDGIRIFSQNREIEFRIETCILLIMKTGKRK